jgi:hypothetical protein
MNVPLEYQGCQSIVRVPSVSVSLNLVSKGQAGVDWDRSYVDSTSFSSN